MYKLKSTKIFKILAIVFTIVLASCSGKSQEKKSKKIVKNENIIEVIDFHSTHRCMTCKAIEASTKYTLDTYFSDELANKKIEFKVVNVDDEKNFKMAEAFEATGTALFLNVIVDGK
ncbi:MAG: hypothetical protein COC22_07135 [Flavobacteriaceae bacterium]|nr:MAG: hypothetical protein COC22_07135 [Flavobacteriaceae bacterium]